MASVAFEQNESAEMRDPSGVRLYPGYLGSPGEEIFAWLHQPESAGRDLGVIICAPLGYEYTHSHRSLRALANALARHGIPVVRFDYFGTGDSAGDHIAEGLVARWLENVAQAAHALREATGVPRMALVGVRAGAALAAEAASRSGACALGFWAPIPNGRRWVRELKALSATAQDGAARGAEGVLQAAGFQFTDESLAAISAWNITDNELSGIENLLILERDDLAPQDKLVRALEGRVTQVARERLPGYLEMMAEPHFTELPTEFIQSTCNWACSISKPRTLRNGSLAGAASATPSPGVEEHLMLTVGSRPIFGILGLPTDGLSNDKPLVVLANSGSVHHVGPNRTYVELARALAVAGIASVRVDLGNLGDSIIGTPDRLNHPYPREAVKDLCEAVMYVRRQIGLDRVALAGLCSGSHTAFHSASSENLDGVEHLIMINPLTFFYRDGMSLETPKENQSSRDAAYYRGIVGQRDRWVKLFKGQADVRYIVGYVARRAGERVLQSCTNMLEATGLRKPTPLAQQLAVIRARGTEITLIVADSDPGEDILKRSGGYAVKRMVTKGELLIERIDEADHTFSRSGPRKTFVSSVVDIVRQNSLSKESAPS